MSTGLCDGCWMALLEEEERLAHEEEEQQRQQLEQHRRLQQEMFTQALRGSDAAAAAAGSDADPAGPLSPASSARRDLLLGLGGEPHHLDGAEGTASHASDDVRDVVWGYQPSGTMAPVAGGAHRAHEARPGSWEWRLYYGFGANSSEIDDGPDSWGAGCLSPLGLSANAAGASTRPAGDAQPQAPYPNTAESRTRPPQGPAGPTLSREQ
eukprot:CAMPEP_0178428216 /NCGR_PEP_ID=MMETSP0689_2-20121128/30160_1 /TAXON_ID=160604 /ORGANISM="Amphidinium massartii, Strain CS-259" /LENGTH=209 /DNA_ID=CAMNT_0020049975 /DNA_START=186 /DNA_END=816 /DNA_ORIENTATION=+